MKFFYVNDDHTISVHYDNLNPIEVENLIKQLQGNLDFLRSDPVDPIKVFHRSIRRSAAGIVTFRFGWNLPEIEIHQDDADLENPPEPNVNLSQEQYEIYANTFRRMFAEED